MPRLSEFEGRGVWYWASAIEAKMCAGADVALVETFLELHASLRSERAGIAV